MSPKTILSSILLSLVSFLIITACTQENINDSTATERKPTSGNQIYFTSKDSIPYKDFRSTTRASQATAATVTSYAVTTSWYSNAQSYATQPCGNYFYNERISTTDGKSGYYWPGTDYRLSFYAYTPCDDSNISIISSKDDTGIPTYRYTIPSAVEDQSDFMTCNVLDHEGLSFSAIPLSFSHRCSELRFSVVNNSSDDISLNTIKVIGSKYQGTLDNDAWSLEGNANTVSDHPFVLDYNNTIPTGDTVDVTGESNHFIMIPQTIAQNSDFLVVTTTESGEDKTYTYTLANALTLTAGLSYCYTLSIGDTDTHEYVDLGLSVKWATMNIGAESPEEYGDYYAWGEIATKRNYPYQLTFDKYNATDEKMELDPEDDVVCVIWGGKWRMPTKEEFEELKDNCTWTWYEEYNNVFNGVAGMKVQSNIEGYTDNYIFLPAAGQRYQTSRYNINSSGFYWSSNLYKTSYERAAYSLYFYNNYKCVTFNDRYEGYPIRAVRK